MLKHGKETWSLETRYRIVALRERKVTFSDIAKLLGLKSDATAYQTYQHYLREGSVMPNKPTGRPRKLNERAERSPFSSILGRN